MTNPVYGLMAQTVAPNPKCESCLHYNSQRGQTGVCEIGLRPVTCGNGDMPSIGYAPTHAIGPDAQNHLAPTGQAPVQPGSTTMVPGSKPYAGGGFNPAMAIVSLGEEHAEMVKSIENQMVTEQLGRYSQLPAIPALRPAQVRKPPSTSSIAKSLTKTLTNRERFNLGDHIEEYVEAFVRAVRAGQDMEGVHKSLTEMTVSKGYYGDDWLAQFRGTDLFDDAVKLCEEELTLAEEDLKRRIERTKKDRERAAHLAKLNQPETNYSWDEQYQKQDALRIKKQRLQLKLAKLAQKMVSGKKVSKSDAGVDLKKSISWGKTKMAGKTVQVGQAHHGSYRVIPHPAGGAVVSYSGHSGGSADLGRHRTVASAVQAAETHHSAMPKKA